MHGEEASALRLIGHSDLNGSGDGSDRATGGVYILEPDAALDSRMTEAAV